MNIPTTFSARWKLLAALVIAVGGFALGQATRVQAYDEKWLTCAPYTSEQGYSSKSPASAAWTADAVGYCWNYYLTVSMVYNGTPYTWPDGGWAAAPRTVWPGSGVSSIFATHNTYRDWYNGYVSTAEY